MLTILIPAAGEGKRFREAGYDVPKPLIPVRGVPMLRRVIDNVRPAGPTGGYCFILIAREDHRLQDPVNEWMGDSEWGLVGLHQRTDGAARTCLVARDAIPPDQPLLVCNCDQLVEGGIRPLLETDADCAVLTFDGKGERRWSYLQLRSRGDTQEISRVVEKPDKSMLFDRATTGHYYFRRAGDFFAACECMIALGDRTGGEFYVAPSINYLIAARKKVVEVRVEDYGGRFVGLGTPEDLKEYEEGV